MSCPNEVPIESVVRQYIGDETTDLIDRSEFHVQELTIRTVAGDTLMLRLSRATARKLTRVTIALITSLAGYFAWGEVTGKIVSEPPASHVTCSQR